MDIATHKGTITNKQLLLAVACFIFGSTLQSSFSIGVTKQDTWIVVITGFIVGAIVALICLTLSSKFPGKTIIEINEIVYGKVIGKVVSSLYIFVIFSSVYLNTRDVGNFIVRDTMPQTPLAAILIIFIFVCAFAVNKGIVAIVRLGFLFFLLYIIALIISIILLLNNMNFSYFSPSFTLPIMNYVQGTHIIGLIPFGEVYIFMMIYPSVDKNCKVKKSVLSGMLIAAIAMLIIAIRDWSVLGSTATIFKLPTYQTVSVIEVGETLSRAEALFSISFVVLLFFKISVMYYALMIAFAQIFNIKSYKPLTYIVGIISICLSILIYDSVSENAYFAPNIAPTYVTFFAVVLPILALLIAKARGIGRKRGCT